MTRCWCIAVLTVLAPLGALACPCVDTEVVRIDEDSRRLFATVSETSKVMVTAALWELLVTKINREYGDWNGRWQVSFYTTVAAAQADHASPQDHVADYDREHGLLTMWPGIEGLREEVSLDVK